MSSDKRPPPAEQPPPEADDGATPPKRNEPKSTAQKKVTLDSRMLIDPGVNECPAGFKRDANNECQPVFD